MIMKLGFKLKFVTISLLAALRHSPLIAGLMHCELHVL